MPTTTTDGGPSVAHEIRITNHGKIRNWVAFALEHFQASQKHEDRPLVLHTLPAPKGNTSTVPDGRKTQDGAPPQPPEGGDRDSAEKGAKTDRLHTSMANMPRLVSVVEIIKREYLKTLDPALAQTGSLSGLHQYNEIGELEEQGLVEGTGDEEQERTESLAQALQGRHHLRQKKTAFMRVTLCRKEAPELVRKGVTYQRPAVRKLSKTTRARLKKRLKKAQAESGGGAGGNGSSQVGCGV